ncbi:MAG TPA: CehA/McbA family metallohydrolase [Desulfobacteria bacterium]|nr:CehA/McbA family metallohydrolase [Desulfobacteria bacterium]
MTRVLVCCLVLLVLFGMTFSVEAEDAGSVTLDFTQFSDQMKMVNQSERPSYGIEATTTVKSSEFTSMNIKVVRLEDGVELICWESNITTLENITIDLVPGTYKVYTQLEGDNTVLEYNNDSDGYVITPQSHVVIPMAYPPYTEGYILDVPWRIENSEMSIPILAVDTGVDWADIYNINVYDYNNGDSLVASTNWESLQPIDSSNTPFFYLFQIDKNLFVQVDGTVSIRIKFELHLSPDNWEGPINVQISQYDIPKITDWYYGDTHQHTNYTYNAVEFGAPIYATRAANNAMGLDWMIVTDHSFDLNPDKWNVSSADCDAHSDNLFRVIPGEEVSCYLPGTTQYNHLLVYDCNFIPGGEWEDGTSSDYTPAEAIAIANSQGGITYPAHPFHGDAFRDPWQNYSLNFNGLQIWNYGSWHKDYPDNLHNLPDGLAKWSERLLDGRHVYVEGGTDAHGDFNTCAGKVKTYVHVPGYSQNSLPPRSGILNALRNGHSVMTDGPLVVFNITQRARRNGNYWR